MPVVPRERVGYHHVAFCAVLQPGGARQQVKLYMARFAGQDVKPNSGMLKSTGDASEAAGSPTYQTGQPELTQSISAPKNASPIPAVLSTIHPADSEPTVGSPGVFCVRACPVCRMQLQSASCDNGLKLSSILPLYDLNQYMQLELPVPLVCGDFPPSCRCSTQTRMRMKALHHQLPSLHHEICLADHNSRRF